MFLRNKKWRIRGKGPGAGPLKDDPFFREQFKALRAKIDAYLEKDGSRTLAITSAVSEEGKTVVSVNLAMNLANTGRRNVLLVDADMHKTGVASAMRLKSVPGLSEVLSGSEEIRGVLQNSRVPGLSVITAGKEPSSPADMLSGDKFRSLLQYARENFDLILLDTPPVMPVADAISLREEVDWFLLVFRVGFTPYPLLKQAVSEIGEQKILGVVLNRVKLMEDRYYTRYYGKYYKK
jgi:capsular exopolysaccharide synthesis family protein